MPEPLLKWRSTLDLAPTGSSRGVKDMAAVTAEEIAGEIQDAVQKEIVKVMRGKNKVRVVVRVTTEPIPVFHPAEDDDA